jgi:hypothetical protein
MQQNVFCSHQQSDVYGHMKLHTIWDLQIELRFSEV